MYKVTYTIKDDNGYLKIKNNKFRSFSDTVKFVRSLKGRTFKDNKPVIERVA